MNDNPMFEREILLIGKERFERLDGSLVMLFGVGGVGGYVLEGLVRAGVGHLVLVDGDEVSVSNINRQIIADTKTVGLDKVEAASARAKLINPNVCIQTRKIFVTAENAAALIDEFSPDYIVDAIDTVSAKIAIIKHAYTHGIKIVSSMGTGNKLDPTRFMISDIYKTSVCPLARVMRRELKARGVMSLKVLWSDELPLTLEDGSTPTVKADGRNAPGSISFVPSVGGLIIAGEVVRDLMGGERVE